jgi:hypothetical protein
MTAGWKTWTLSHFCFRKRRGENAGIHPPKPEGAHRLVCGEPNYDALSDFVLEQEKLRNFGYYENELILIKRFGALSVPRNPKPFWT